MNPYVAKALSRINAPFVQWLNPAHPRHERRTLGISARQQRKAKVLARRANRTDGPTAESTLAAYDPQVAA
jgi:hypothetical protein